ncbi:hypothetical protein BDN70DRAFT_939859, partial [Pholiota conissans]
MKALSPVKKPTGKKRQTLKHARRDSSAYGPSDSNSHASTEFPQYLGPAHQVPKRVESRTIEPEASLIEQPPLVHYGPQSYQWSRNSCWLDTSLELLYNALSTGGLEEFSVLCTDLPNGSPLLPLRDALVKRKDLMTGSYTQAELIQNLTHQRNTLRDFLAKKRFSKKIGEFDGIWVYVSEIVRRIVQDELRERFEDSKKPSQRAIQYFQTLLTEMHECTGVAELGGRHVEIQRIPRRRVLLDISDYTIEQYGGDLAAYFKDYFSLTRKTVPRTCWRTRDSVPLCTGERKDTESIIISIPVIFAIEVSATDNTNTWNFPSTIIPLSETAAKDHHVIYDLVGYAMLTQNRTHFTAKYVSRSTQSHSVYTYDGRQNGGQPFRIDGDLTSNVDPGDFVAHAFYYLRGGIQAQQMFVNLRGEELSKKYPLGLRNTDLASPLVIEYLGKDLKLMNAKDRFWKRDPYLKDTAEYVSIPSHTRQLPSARTPADVESEDDGESLPQWEVLESKTGLAAPMEGIQAVGNFEMAHIPISHSPFSSSQQSKDIDAKIPTKQASAVIQSLELPIAYLSPDEEMKTLFHLDCRCRLSHKGDSLDDIQNIEDTGELVQCTLCESWSHIACQREGRASKLGTNDSFECDNCNLSSVPGIIATRTLGRVEPPRNAPLADRLIRGCGALARHGLFWYPVRLIHTSDGTTWRVRWWIGCQFEDAEIQPGSITTVSFSDLVDSLWQDRHGRRKIRLGRWCHASEVATSEDILSDPSSIPYTREIDEILAPACEILQKLLVDPEKMGTIHIPAKAWLRKNKKPLASSMVPFASGVTIAEQAMIQNWFLRNICNDDQRLNGHWIGRLPIAHAITVFLAHREKLKKINLSKIAAIKKGWTTQTEGTLKDVFCDVNIDAECLARLEELMFERSERAGAAGNWQWGLDVGDHQGSWDPYNALPSHWNEGPAYSETELEV